MNIEELFIKASRKKYRYNFKGVIGTEDLWDLSVEDLDSIFRTMRTEMNRLNIGESLLNNDKTDGIVATLRDKIEIIRYIVNVKQEEKQKAIEATERAALREKILREKETRESEKLNNMTDEELDAMLEKLK